LIALNLVGFDYVLTTKGGSVVYTNLSLLTPNRGTT